MMQQQARIVLFAILVMLLMAAVCPARDFLRDCPPRQWIERYLPENLPPLKLPAYYTDVEKARAQAFAGRYKLALITLGNAKSPDPVQAVLVEATALGALGRHEAALRKLSAPAVADDPMVQISRANLHGELGQFDQAIALLREHLRKHPASLAGHYYLGQMCEQAGDIAAAKTAYGWFVEGPDQLLNKWRSQNQRGFDNAEDVTLIARGIDRWACLTSAYRNDSTLHNVLLNMFIRAYDVIDRQYWPARVAAAEYFLSHDDPVNAGKQVLAALQANPNDIRTLSLAGAMALQSFNFDGADKAIASIRKVDRDSIAACLMEARNYLLQRRPKDAHGPLQIVLKRQPNNVEAMGLLAGAYALQLNEKEATALLKQVDAIDPDNATAYLEVAEQLGSMRQYPRAAEMYQRAIERAPWWSAARNGLGLLYTQSGEEDKARVVLDAAHALDPFNLASTNYLRLLDDMEKLARKESAHFIVMYDEKLDPVIAEYFTDYLEGIHKEVCAAYAHEPADKTMIEVFPTHDAFSVRTTGSPWIGTVGASTGRVIALVTPRGGKNTMGTFHWAQVLRHEYTHTVTLSATDNRITHWMTEGLAVMQEQSPLRWEWVPMLYQAVTKKELFTMDQITWGFVRPKRPQDRSLAYAQSFWICQYIEQKYGHDAILKMMAEFRAGRSQEEVFPSVLKCTQDEFTTEFFAWAQKQVAGWGYDKDTTVKYEKLCKNGEQQIKTRQYVAALSTWLEAQKLRPMDELPHQRLAGLYLSKQINQPQKAIPHLAALDRVEIKDNRYAKRIARLYRDDGKLNQAVTYARQAITISSYDLEAHQLLAGLLEKTSDQKDLARERRVISALTKWIAENNPSKP